MQAISQTITYFLLFVALYFEVFLFITYLETSPKRKAKKLAPKTLPSVSIIVPCWNEATTLSATIHSILDLNYPKEKLSILIIDDGSTDDTRERMQEFAGNSQVKLLYKENGGKHTALNHALQFVTSDMVGCLDADSFVDKEALNKIVAEFHDTDLMAVTPSIKINNPKNILELVQKVEYGWGVMLRNLMASLGAIYVTPGPFSIFRKSVFDQLGGYRKGHNTEDMELAVRMQKAHMKIGNAPDAFIYTTAPKNIKALYKQRLRWTYGFLMNAIDNKDIYFNPKYGNLGMVVLPTATLSIFSSVYLVLTLILSWVNQGIDKVSQVATVGFNPNWSWNFDLFYMDTTIVTFISVIAFLGTCAMLLFSRKMSEGHSKPGLDILYFFALYAFLAPIWMSKALYNVALNKKTSWR